MDQEHMCVCGRTKIRNEEEQKALIHRLNRIEGQVRGIRGMIERDAYCVDVITQVAAITAALNAFNKALLGEHIRTCVTADLKNGKTETAEELVNVLQKLMR
ncbi:MAG: metal-sensing transcriptional repressor [Ruminococcaceae bacterium]|nr:metal-sensing transcriptional repressor [Oscillospiraceae bacterium]